MLNSALRWAAAAATIVVAAACSGGTSHHDSSDTGAAAGPTVAATDGPGGVQQVTINATNSFRFDPATITAHPGTLKVTLVDTGSYPHNLAVDALHFMSQTVTGSPGENTTTFTLRFAKPGSYPFVCTFHSTAGMRGKFVIQ